MINFKIKNMKKYIIFIMVLACCSQINAQIHFGIKGGINFDNFKLKDAKELSISNTTGWQAGVLLQFRVPVIGIGVQPEVLYTVRNAKANDVSNSVSYLEVPLNVQWGLNLAIVRPYLMAGPYFSYAMNFKGDEFKKRLDKFDWGVGLGAGIEIRKIQLGARYQWGLQNVSRVRDFEMKNNSFRLSLAILF